MALIDPKGNVFVVDRVKELIKVKGFQVIMLIHRSKCPALRFECKFFFFFVALF